jgi:hypothetical protein
MGPSAARTNHDTSLKFKCLIINEKIVFSNVKNLHITTKISAFVKIERCYGFKKLQFS